MDGLILLGLDGTYNQDVHEKLAKILKAKANHFVMTNRTMDPDDLVQSAWVKIFDVIKKGLGKGKQYNIEYLITVGHNAMIYACQVNSKINGKIDITSTKMFNDPIEVHRRGERLDPYRVQYEIVKDKHDDIYGVEVRTSIESVLDTLGDNAIKNLILIRYVKEIGGDAISFISMYNNFRDSLNDEKRNQLDNMNKFSMKEAFDILGIRHTDNVSTRIRQSCRDVLAEVYYDYCE